MKSSYEEDRPRQMSGKKRGAMLTPFMLGRPVQTLGKISSLGRQRRTGEQVTQISSRISTQGFQDFFVGNKRCFECSGQNERFNIISVLLKNLREIWLVCFFLVSTV